MDENVTALQRFHGRTLVMSGKYVDCIFENCTLFLPEGASVDLDGCDVRACSPAGHWHPDVADLIQHGQSGVIDMVRRA